MEAEISCRVKRFKGLKVSPEFAGQQWNVKANHRDGTRKASKVRRQMTAGFVLMVKDLPMGDGYSYAYVIRPTWRKKTSKIWHFFLLLAAFAS
jgi:hypothetical protein